MKEVPGRSLTFNCWYAHPDAPSGAKIIRTLDRIETSFLELLECITLIRSYGSVGNRCCIA